MSRVAFIENPNAARTPGAESGAFAQWSLPATDLVSFSGGFEGKYLNNLGFPKLSAYQRATRPAELAIAVVRNLVRYGAGWDGYDAEAPCLRSIRDATDFLSRTRSGAAFRVVLGSDGLLTLEVDGVHGIVRLAFEGDGRVIASTKVAGLWQEFGSFQIREGLGRASSDIERLIGAS